MGSLIILPFIHPLANLMDNLPLPKAELVIYFHVFYNLVRCLAMVPFAAPMARFCERLIQDEPEAGCAPEAEAPGYVRAGYPALALANAARETLRMGDAMETMLEGLQKVMHGEPREEKELRRLADDINVLYTAIKLYLARMPQTSWRKRSPAAGRKSSRCRLTLSRPRISWSVMGSEIADKSLAARRAFSGEGLKELEALHEQLVSNLKLAMLVFFSSDVPSARRLRRNKHRFRILNRR